MRRLPLYLVVISCCISMALLSARQPEELPSPTPAPETIPPNNFLYSWNTVTIKNIVVKDGDSFFCDFCFTGTLVDKNIDCRMLGYDSWEASFSRQSKDVTVTPEEIVLGKKAKTFLSNLILTAENDGKPIHAVFYVGSNPGILRVTPPADNYGRKLIFVYIDGQPLSKIMTVAGHAPRRNLPPTPLPTPTTTPPKKK
jgi:hypothetical protein